MSNVHDSCPVPTKGGPCDMLCVCGCVCVWVCLCVCLTLRKISHEPVDELLLKLSLNVHHNRLSFGISLVQNGHHSQSEIKNTKISITLTKK